MKLVIGLGNPGKQYETTRHNIGFRILDELCSEWTLMTKCSALLCKQPNVLYAKPQTYMNLSGASVQALLHYYDITLEDLVVVYDDKDLPFGALRYRPKGSSGGHNGMNSIIGVLGSSEFARLRIGVAPVNEEGIVQPINDTAKFVLQPFSKEESQQLPEIITTAISELKKHLEI